MLYWSNYFLNQSNWGVVGEADGALVLAHDFVGPPKIYDPLDQRLTPSNFPGNDSSTIAANVSTGPMYLVWGPHLPIDGDGQYSVFSPGILRGDGDLDRRPPHCARQSPRRARGGGGGAAARREDLYGLGMEQRRWGGDLLVPRHPLPGTISGCTSPSSSRTWNDPVSFDSVVLRQTAPAITGEL